MIALALVVIRDAGHMGVQILQPFWPQAVLHGLQDRGEFVVAVQRAGPRVQVREVDAGPHAGDVAAELEHFVHIAEHRGLAHRFGPQGDRDAFFVQDSTDLEQLFLDALVD